MVCICMHLTSCFLNIEVFPYCGYIFSLLLSLVSPRCFDEVIRFSLIVVCFLVIREHKTANLGWSRCFLLILDKTRHLLSITKVDCIANSRSLLDQFCDDHNGANGIGKTWASSTHKLRKDVLKKVALINCEVKLSSSATSAKTYQGLLSNIYDGASLRKQSELKVAN